MAESDVVTGQQCARCRAPLPAASARGRPRLWCSHVCRRAAYEERRAAERGAIAVRIAVREKVIEKHTHEIQYVDRIVEKPPAKPAPAVAAETVLSSPRACRSVLEGLTKQARAGDLNRGESAPTVRAAIQFLRALRDANLLG